MQDKHVTEELLGEDEFIKQRTLGERIGVSEGYKKGFVEGKFMRHNAYS